MRGAIVETFALLRFPDLIGPRAAARYQHDFTRTRGCDHVEPARLGGRTTP